MRNLLLVAALLGLAACQRDYNRSERDSITSNPPTNPAGSAGYQRPGSGPSSGFDTTSPTSATGSAGYQGSGTGTSDRLSASPPRNPTGSAGYQR